jgi:DNA polymerase-1
MLVGADYSQIEMRVLAHLCRDAKMAALFARQGDIYRHLAGQIFGKAADDVGDEERTIAKVVCLGEPSGARHYTDFALYLIICCTILYDN